LCSRFIFRAEDGIRDRNVTGVQTCALPICVADRGRHGHWCPSPLMSRAVRRLFARLECETHATYGPLGALGRALKTPACRSFQCPCLEPRQFRRVGSRVRRDIFAVVLALFAVTWVSVLRDGLAVDLCCTGAETFVV